MDFKLQAEALFDGLGCEVEVMVGDDQYDIKALVQPMRYKNKMYLEDERTELGTKNGECFLYLGPAEPDFSGKENQTVVRALNRNFSVSRADRITLKGITQYIWAVLTPRIKDGGYDVL